MTHPPRTTAQALAESVDLMVTVHDATCPDTSDHSPRNCHHSISMFAAADALDVVRGPYRLDRVSTVAGALHDRMCMDFACGPAQRGIHLIEWLPRAAAVERWYDSQTVATTSAGARTYDRRMCQCGHIRMGHSVDGSRCYASPCTCAADGGFREEAA